MWERLAALRVRSARLASTAESSVGKGAAAAGFSAEERLAAAATVAGGCLACSLLGALAFGGVALGRRPLDGGRCGAGVGPRPPAALALGGVPLRPPTALLAIGVIGLVREAGRGTLTPSPAAAARGGGMKWSEPRTSEQPKFKVVTLGPPSEQFGGALQDRFGEITAVPTLSKDGDARGHSTCVDRSVRRGCRFWYVRGEVAAKREEEARD